MALSGEQVLVAAQEGGFPQSVLVEAASYAGIESGWDTEAVSSTGCQGLWQICGTSVSCNLFGPECNAQAAYLKWRGCGGSFACDWDPYDGGRSNPNWGYWSALAQSAYQQLFPLPPPPPAPTPAPAPAPPPPASAPVADVAIIAALGGLLLGAELVRRGYRDLKREGKLHKVKL